MNGWRVTWLDGWEYSKSAVYPYLCCIYRVTECDCFAQCVFRDLSSFWWLFRAPVPLRIITLGHDLYPVSPQRGAADAEIKVPSGENTELKRSPFKAWSMSVYSHTCYAYCQNRFPPCLFLPFRSIHLHFFPKPPNFFPMSAVANTCACVGPHNKIGHPAGCRFPC